MWVVVLRRMVIVTGLGRKDYSCLERQFIVGNVV